MSSGGAMDSLTASYLPPPSGWDEMTSADGLVREPWREVGAVADLLGLDGLRARGAEATSLLESDGVTYRSPQTGVERPWELDPIPLLVHDIEWASLEEKAYDVLQRRGDDPRMQHAKGIAQLLVARGNFVERSAQLAGATSDEQKNVLDAARSDFVVERNLAIALLQSAAVRVPNKASYQNDLAAALIETHEAANLDRAVKACDQALRIEPRFQDALFNRAIALRELSDPQRAIAAFKLYLTVDPLSPWAGEARQNIENLQPSL